MRRHFLGQPFLPIVFAPLALFLSSILRGEVFFWGTPILQFFPWRFWAWRTILNGEIPLWNPLVGMGSPLIANYQSGVFYPPNWLTLFAYALGGVSWMTTTQTILVVCHLIWAGIGASLLLKRLKTKELAQTVGGLAFCMSGYLVARAGFFSINAAVAWLPWIILFVDSLVYYIRNGIRRFLLPISGLIFVLALQFLSGHAQTTWMTLMLAFLWSGFRAVVNDKETQAQGKVGQTLLLCSFKSHLAMTILRIGKIWAILIFSILAAISLSAIQLFPTFEYLLQSQRATAVEYDLAMTYSFWPWHFINLIAPNFFGNPATGDYWGYGNYWEDAIYIGLLPFMLSLSALVVARKSGNGQLSFFLMSIILLSFLFALGVNTPIYPWLYHHVPGFQMFQAPARFTLWAVFALSLLAGLGVDFLQRPQGGALYILRLATVGCISLILCSLLLNYIQANIRVTMIRATTTTGVFGFLSGLLVLNAPEPLNLNKNQVLNGQVWGWLVTLFVMLDLIFFDWGLNPTVNRVIYIKVVPNIEKIRQYAYSGRIYLPSQDEYSLKFERFFRFDSFHIEESWENLRAIPLPNINIFDDIPSVNNFDPLTPSRYSHWMKALNDASLTDGLKMLKIMNVSAILRVNSKETLEIDLQKIQSYPRIRWVPCAVWVDNGESALNVLLRTSNEDDFVILEKMNGNPTNGELTCDPKEDAEVEIIKESPNRIEIRAFANSPGYLVISDVWYPGWTAFVNGHSIQILRANYLFRALMVPKGNSHVVLSYKPISFYGGMILSIVSFLMLIGMFIRYRDSFMFISRPDKCDGNGDK